MSLFLPTFVETEVFGVILLLLGIYNKHSSDISYVMMYIQYMLLPREGGRKVHLSLTRVLSVLIPVRWAAHITYIRVVYTKCI